MGTLPNGGCFLSSLAFFSCAEELQSSSGFPTAEALHAAGTRLRRHLCERIKCWGYALPDDQHAQLAYEWELEDAPWETVDEYANAMANPTEWYVYCSNAMT